MTINKGRRHELKMIKFKARLKKYGFKQSDGNMNAFRSHGKPCSCYLCSANKYKHNGDVKLQSNELRFQINNSF